MEGHDAAQGNLEELVRRLDAIAGRLQGMGSMGEGAILDAQRRTSEIVREHTAVAEWRAEATDTMAAGMPESAQEREINITVPINIDGMELGTAAIRGINAVTRATGKLMLDI